MATMNVSLADDLREFVDQRVADGGYSGSSDYVRSLIRRDKEEEAKKERLIAILRSAKQEIDAGDFVELASDEDIATFIRSLRHRATGE